MLRLQIPNDPKERLIYVLCIIFCPVLIVLGICILPFHLSFVILDKVFPWVEKKYAVDDPFVVDNKRFKNRWWFRVAYILGGLLMICIPNSFWLCSSHPTDQLIGIVFLSLIPVFLLPVIGIVLRWKLICQNKKLFIKTKKMSVPNELREFKKLLDEGVITQEEFDQKKRELL